MNRKVIFEALKNGIVEIDFRSLKSGNNKTATCTLVKGDHSFLPNQDTNNEKIVVWREDLNTYEDIQWDTIISWRQCETPVSKSKG